ncbi:MAG: hypothetical protein JSV15_02730 [Candidatus Bathyarchaeota archaeon]|nr:MAG: hypothetical protein JSV15_02730 [Candidatus Bathyarchaeota archaeon]
MRKKLLVVAMMVAISLPLVGYAWIEIDKGVWAEKNQEASSDVTEFKAVVNGMRSMDVFVCVNISDGLTEKEAELIAGTTFIQVKGEYVWRRLNTLTFDDIQIKAHYAWGYDETDLGHVFDMIADLTTLQITVDHCF